ATFALQGVQYTNFMAEKQRDHLTDVLPMSDGRFVAVGTVTDPYWEPLRTYRPVLARYNADGTFDRTFGVGGAVAGDIGGLFDQSERLRSLNVIGAALQPDGGIVLVGRETAINGFSNTTIDRTWVMWLTAA